MKICVFCGSSDQVDPIYLTEAAKLGEILSNAAVEVYYGAGNSGLMAALSAPLIKNKKVINGVIPKETLISAMINPEISKVFTTHCLSSRKRLMLTECDMFIILPGGIGTVDEFFDVIAYKQIYLDWQNKKCILININGYFDLLLKFLENTLRSGFTRDTDIQLFEVLSRTEDIKKSFTPTNEVEQ